MAQAESSPQRTRGHQENPYLCRRNRKRRPRFPRRRAGYGGRKDTRCGQPRMAGGRNGQLPQDLLFRSGCRGCRPCPQNPVNDRSAGYAYFGRDVCRQRPAHRSGVSVLPRCRRAAPNPKTARQRRLCRTFRRPENRRRTLPRLYRSHPIQPEQRGQENTGRRCPPLRRNDPIPDT